MASTAAQPDGAIEGLLEFLETCAVQGTRGSESAAYTPSAPLVDYLKQNIESLLRAVSPEDPQLHLARGIVEDHSRVFAILIKIKKASFIHYFAEHDLCDNKLPFSTNTGFPRSDDFFKEFQQEQWKFCPPILRHGFYKTFSKDCILPFEREAEPIASGNCGVIYKIKIPHEYDLLCAASKSEQVRPIIHYHKSC